MAAQDSHEQWQSARQGEHAMKHCMLAGAAIAAAAAMAVQAQAPTAVTPESLVAAAKRAAGLDHAGTFMRICVAPDNLNATPRPAPPTDARAVPDRATWYAAPDK